MKRTGPTNVQVRKLIRFLRKASNLYLKGKLEEQKYGVI